ncbi:unknown [Rickettsia felis URRWXCal2]|uniref:Uncharacterized protein n=1 Tax=Rickettsia felis (strain ATCC VR-1525 / URRWXCal2) TaxID=315456 RepID=Q4UK66_RICFE|nr:unknown [Rickettsia felis URRWXCal2]
MGNNGNRRSSYRTRTRGVLVELLSWQFAFFINAPIALVIIAFGIVWIPESSNPSNEPWDWIGVFQSFFGMAALVQGIKMLAKYGIMNLASGGILLNWYCVTNNIYLTPT